MRFGAPFASGFGSHSKMLSANTWVDMSKSSAIRIRPQPATGVDGGYWGIYVNAQLMKTIYYDEDEVGTIMSLPTFGETFSVAILRHGHASNIDMSRVVRLGYSYLQSKRVTIFWSWTAEVLGIPGNTDLSNWSLSGITKDNLESHDLATRRKLVVDVETTSSGITTVSLYRNNTLVASGSGTGPATITLTAQNSSGISGTVDITADPEDVEDGNLVIRYPKSIKIYRNTGSLAGTAYFPDTKWTELSDLSAGTYDYSYAFVSDTGEEGAETTPEEITINDPPGRPTSLAHDSGDYTDTRVSFTASATSGATYNVYLQQPDEDFINFNDPVDTVGAIVGTGYADLPELSYPGIAYVVIRAVYGGIEETNTIRLALEYDDSGNYVDPRPNNLAIESWSIDDGTDLTVEVAYDPTDELATPTKANLYAKTYSGSYSLKDTQNLTSNKATLTETLTNGWWYIAVKAETAGGVESEDYSAAQLIYVADTSLSAPTVTSYVSRG